MTVRTRFAPSPTGYLHIGGVRTALFNWLFARGHGGQFLLRIDDTDAQRNVAEALEPILHGFRWLGLDWDEGPGIDGPFAPYFQSQRSDLYQQAVDRLLESGHAYRDFATPEELQAERDAAASGGQPFTYSRRWRADTPAEAQAFQAQGRAGVVRLLMPREAACEIDDLIRGRVRFDWANEQDHVIQRADGTCLYHLATVVDDIAMEITHVIRAEEHLSNTPRQAFIFQALGAPAPRFAHLPVVAEPGSKNKLSKRKLDKYLKNRDFAQLMQRGTRIAELIGFPTSAETFNPVIVDFYERTGFLPGAVLNYLLLLGWSLDDTTEEFDRQSMIDSFTLERVNKSPASFDPLKLLAFQDRAMQKHPLKQRVAMCVGFLVQAGLVSDPPPCETGPYVTQIVEAAGDRIKLAGDILEYDDFFLADEDLKFDPDVLEKRLRKPAEAVDLLQGFRDLLAEQASFDAAAAEGLLKGYLETRGAQIGQLIHALRVAVTGKGVGLGMFDALAILGPQRCVARIDRALAQVRAGG